MKRRAAFAWALAALLTATTAHADLIKIGTANHNGVAVNLIYEPAQNLVWADHSWYGTPAGAPRWAGLSNVTLDPLYTTDIDWTAGWRWAATVDGPWEGGYDGTTTAGYNITSSEMGHLFYVSLGNIGRYDKEGNLQSDYGLNSVGPFEELKAQAYWSGTEYTYAQETSYWTFSFRSGLQSYQPKSQSFQLLAVHEGTVSVVPVPGAGVLGLLGLGSAGAWLRRRWSA